MSIEQNRRDINQFYGVQSEEVEEVEPPKKYLIEAEEIKKEDTVGKDFAVIEDLGNNMRIIRYHKRKLLVGNAYNTKCLDVIFERINQGKACIILVSGEAGSGKSWYVLSIASILDRRFLCERQITFTREKLMNLIGEDSPLRRKQVIIIDESQFQLSSRSWFTGVQRDLTENLASVRFRGLVIIIVSIDRSLLDSLVREHLLSFQCHLERRGVATLYQVRSHRFNVVKYPKRIGTLSLSIPDERCKSPNCLVCPASGLSKEKWMQRDHWEEIGFRACNNLRVRYERLKRESVDTQARESNERMADVKQKRMKDEEIIDKLIPFVGEIEKMKNGHLSVDSMIAVCASKVGIEIKHVRGYQIRQKMVLKLAELEGVKK